MIEIQLNDRVEISVRIKTENEATSIVTKRILFRTLRTYENFVAIMCRHIMQCKSLTIKENVRVLRDGKFTQISSARTLAHELNPKLI